MGERENGTAAETARRTALPPRRARLLDCDLVMKGGITSGLVYPKAVVRIAREYQLRNIGGTSVGAIGAALTAAAEAHRQKQPHPDAFWDTRLDDALNADLAAGARAGGGASPVAESGFSGLYRIPDDIGDDLPGKFQPMRATRWIYHYLFSWMLGFDTLVGKLVAAAFLGLWWPRLAVVVAGLLVFGTIRLLDPSGEGRMSLIVATLVVVAGVVVIRRFVPGVRIPLGWVLAAGLAGTLLLARLIWARWFADSWSVFRGLADTVSLRAAWDELTASWDSVLVDIVPLVAIFWVVGAAIYVAWVCLRLLPGTDFGFCTGLGDDDALTNWLHHRLNQVAGLPDGDVLTFGHLMRTGIDETREEKEERAVALEMIGTDVLRGVPLDLPRALPGAYLFEPSRFRALFPDIVVDALMAGATPDAAGRCPFPPVSRIPVVVAARMSMSFPILFCAVPVWYRDSEGKLWKTWISDGGIISNFPSNKFDRALPPWPTFGLDLVDAGVEYSASIPGADQSMRTWLEPDAPYSMSSAESNPERLPMTTRWTVTGFLLGAVNAARGWVDNSQKRLPGFAERIVAIKLYAGEGGLNLDMDAEMVHRLARRGLLGVDRLIAAWAPDTPDNQWRYHRWVRLRTLMRELEEIGRDWKAWYAADPGPMPLESFQDMADAMPERDTGGQPNPPSRDLRFPYPVANAMDRARAGLLVDAFNTFAEQTDYGLGQGGQVRAAGENLGENAAAVVFDAPDSPEPNPKLLLMPPYE